MIIGKNIIQLTETDSTNEEARRLIRKGAGEGTVIIAGRQSSGRGKPGKSWLSPKGGLYLSAIAAPRINPRSLAPITMIGALAGRAAIIAATGLPVVIKWPNDLLIRGKKVGGVLVERVASGQLIIGLGINVNLGKKDLPAALPATSLLIETKKKVDLGKFSTAAIKELDQAYLEYLRKI